MYCKHFYVLEPRGQWVINKLTSIIAGLGVLLAGVLSVFFAGRKSAADEIKNETAKQALQLQRDADAALRNGLINEQKIRDKTDNDFKRVDLD